ncbi:CAIB/BAIF family [Hyaloraphidium curvatum]|nr:CAIB/BAIF family [Hyaloraphidium curvatum]
MMRRAPFASRRLFATLPEAKTPPLEGLRVLELGQLLAGPFAGSMLGYFGAEVIKVEPPQGGDPLRGWRGLDKDGVSPWWRSLARNKKSVALDLRKPEGRTIARNLALKSDVLIENFKPGTLEKWGMGPDDLLQANPSLVITRVSGYGQNGPYAPKAGYASVCEAMAGFRYVTGFPGEPPVRPNISLGDTVAGLHAVIGILLALVARNKLKPGSGGQVVDVALYESMLNVMEGAIPEYDRLGKTREPSGTTVTGIVPTNVYQCKGGMVVIGGNGDSIYKRLMSAAGRADLANAPECATNAGRVQHQDRIDGAINDWTRTLTVEEALAALEKAEVPAGPIYDVKDIVADPHVKARGMLEEVQVLGAPLKVPAYTPKLMGTPGRTTWAGPDLGAHTREVLMDLLGMDDQAVASLAQKAVVSLGPK